MSEFLPYWWLSEKNLLLHTYQCLKLLNIPQIKHTNCLACQKIVYMLKQWLHIVAIHFLIFIVNWPLGNLNGRKWPLTYRYCPAYGLAYISLSCQAVRNSWIIFHIKKDFSRMNAHLHFKCMQHCKCHETFSANPWSRSAILPLLWTLLWCFRQNAIE